MISRQTARWFGASLLAICVLHTTSIANDPQLAKLEFFEKKIRPILVNHCFACHSADTNSKGGLRVDDRNGLINGGANGAAIVPGKPRDSLLLKRVTQADMKKRMPLEGNHLTDSQVAELTQWIQDGAAWPAARIPATLGKLTPEYEKRRREHWAWQPLTTPTIPKVTDTNWANDDIDRFILARLEAKGIQPVADADPVTLIRRATFDLTGLPPTPAEIEAFVAASSSNAKRAYEKLIDRLLASAQFGERWGRHWLDVARYGESTGPSRNIPYPHAWRYRDYVIDAINADVAFDQFILEQIAGDLLPAKDAGERDRRLTATGFLALGVKDVNQRFKVRFIMDNVDEQIDVVARSILGLTVSCARCHDHKFDPIPTTDYYALAGIFTSTDNCAGVRNKMGGGGLDYYDPSMLVKLTTAPPPVPAAQMEKVKAEFEEAKKQWDAIRGTPEGLKKAADGQPTQRPFRLKFEKLQAELNTLTDPAARGHAVHGLRDAKTVADTEVRLRGEAENLGPVVPRGFLTLFDVPGASSVNRQQSGRLELARWLASPNNPMTARVFVNRVWSYLFGQGIVSTVDNFGYNGAPPSHPELLDHLAQRFIRDAWSIKRLVRTLLLTRAYRLSGFSGDAHAVDPANRLVWRHGPRRLDAEEIRDAMLAAAGTLNPKRPPASPANELKMVEMRDNGPEAANLNTQADRTTVRSVYLPLVRGVTPHNLESFDPVDQTLVSGQRDATTVPGQALHMLNSVFVRRHSLTLAENLLDEKADDAARIHSAYCRVLGRNPSAKEVERAKTFLSEFESAYGPNAAATPKKPKPAPLKPKGPTVVPANPDEVDQTGEAIVLENVEPKSARSAAWMAFVQALFASAEFRFVR
jgi:cytochrome c553